MQKDELVLVGDFGGGTSDFTLMSLSLQNINNANRSMDMISKGGIYIVFLTGGTSIVRSIQYMFHKKFSQAKVKSGDNFNSVAAGLAYSYAVVKED